MCSCNYPIHRVCFARWKETGTQRLCLICQVEDGPLPIVEYVERPLVIEQMVIVHNRRWFHRCCDSVYMMVMVIAFLIWHFYVFHIRK